jgi:signal transduction histidine kinase
MEDRYRFLRDIYFFKSASNRDIEALAKLCKESEHRDGDALCVEGERADRFYIIESGRVEVWRDFGRPDAELLATHGAGKFFGEMALIDDLPRSATAVARGDVRVLSLDRRDFQDLVKERPSIAYGILVSISGMVRASNDSWVQDLRDRNEELENANRELREAQASLLRNERLSTLGKFSSMILHDIRNPLSILRGQLQLLSINIDEPAKRSRNLANAMAELDRIERLACEILDYTRGEIRLNYAIATPRALLEKISSGLEERLSKSGITIVTECVRDEPVLIDAERITRALFNLADNARKAMSSGGTLTLRATRDGPNLEMTVSDTGEGMDPATLERIWEPFYSASSGGGTGLGMLIVKNIVEAHGGSVSVRSDKGAGTSVTIRLPCRA